MNKLITQNYILLASGCLLLASTQALAWDGANLYSAEETANFEPAPELEEMPELEAVPGMEEIPIEDTIIETGEISAVEVEMQQEQPIDEVEVQQEVPADEVEPVIHVYDHRSETEITGDVIELQAGETLPVKVLALPRRGMSMDKVRNELGEPLEISDTVGKPPITTWAYNDRVVYFEYSSVVHVVATH